MTDPYAMGPPPDYRPLRGEPNDLVPPAERAAIYARGALLVREALASVGLDRDQTFVVGTPNCATHPDDPGGSTPAGDPYCPTCRRDRRATTNGETK